MRPGANVAGASRLDVTSSLRGLGLVMAFGVPVALAAAVVAVPVYWLIRVPPSDGRSDPLPTVRAQMLLASGAVIGVCVSALLGPPLRGDLISIPFPAWSGGVLGLLSALTFLLVLRRVSPRRPR